MDAFVTLTSLLTLPSTIFLVLEILIVLVGVLLGLKRGLGRTAVRATYLIIIAVLSLLIGRGIANNVADIVPTFARTVLSTEAPEVIEIMDMAPDLEILVAHLIGALLVPICFATLFVIFQVLSLIFFKKASVSIVTAITKNDEKPSWSKWAGAGAGLVLSLVVAAIVLSPLYTVVAIAENIPESTISDFSEMADVMEADPINTTALKAPVVPTVASLRVTNVFFLNNLVAEKLTSYEIPHPVANEDDHESVIHFIPVLLETAEDAFGVYVATSNAGGEQVDAVTNALAAVVPHLNDSATLKHVAAEALHVLGVSFRDNGSFMGLTLPQTDNAIVNSLIKNIVNTCAETDASSVVINMSSLFGLSSALDDLSINRGLLSSMLKLDQDDPMKSLADEKLAGAVSDAIGNMADNENMAGVITDIKDFAVGLIQDSNINLSDEKYEALYEKISKDLSEQLTIHVGTVEPSAGEKTDNTSEEAPDSQTTVSTVAAVAKSLEETIGEYFEEYDVPVDSFQTSVIATCIAQEFYKEENIVDGSINVTVDEVLDFFGITQEDINNFLGGGGGESTDSPNVNIPEDFDPSDLPEGFDPSDLPEGFDPSDLPEGFDPSNLPEGFDPSDYLPETDGE